MTAPAASPPFRLRAGMLAWSALLLLAVTEVISQLTVVARVPPMSDWRSAAAFVRAAWRDGDVVTSAPAYTDPLLREVLGDRISLADAGRTDLDRYARLWTLSIDGERSPEAPPGPPELVRELGRVRVERWSLGASPVRYDLVRHVRDAEVVRMQGGIPVPCPWRDFFSPSGGGLGAGALTPRARFVCDPGRPWLFVAETVTENLSLAPRDCVWQHPQGGEPIRVTFHDVPLGTRLLFAGGVYSEHERMREHGPIDVVVRANGREIGRMQHHDGDGWKRIEAVTAERADTRGDLSIDVSAPDPQFRTFCWDAKTEAGPRRPEPP